MTVIDTEADGPPGTWAVIVVRPLDLFATTRPFVTVAIAGLEEDHVTVTDGNTYSCNWAFLRIVAWFKALGLKLAEMRIELTGGGGGTGTVTVAVVLPRKKPSIVVAVITAEPPPTAVINPACVTVATAVLLEVHVTVFGVVRFTVPEDLLAVPVIC